jgi:carboxymethylenebutenolidase
MTQNTIDPKIFELYDEYCHSTMTRRDFLTRASSLAIVSGSGIAKANLLLRRYAEAHTINFTDERIKPHYIEYN